MTRTIPVKRGLSRREFIQAAAGSVVALSVPPARTTGGAVSLVMDHADPVAGTIPVQWAAKELERALTTRGFTIHKYETLAQAGHEDFCIIAAGSQSAIASRILKDSHLTVAEVSEALGLVPARVSGRRVLLACGHDSQGLVYALLELSDRLQYGSVSTSTTNSLASLTIPGPIIEQPANAVRSVMKLFVSDVEDRPWYNDREMWLHYLTMLATHRFNRFNLALGLGYDFLRQVTDAYFLFAYPFLLSVPGYAVKVPQLPDAERDSNLAMLKFISEQTVARGLQFQLGIWMHGYEWANSPRANYTIEGLTKETQAAYARDGLRLLLQACPAIGGVTIRTHGESGVEEGSYDFWKTVFAGVADCGRKVEIDLHTKGLDQTMLDVALATRQPIRVSPKFWAEHLGLPYHQADIREIEARAGEQFGGLLKISQGSRNFLRYGYGDLLREDRKWSVSHRVWPGSQRLLLWGDPETAAAYSRAFGFCGSDGAEIMEPLSFKGRRGSGIAGNRCGYADQTLRPRWDWEKYSYSYRVWGRLLYNPHSDSDPWHRYLTTHFGKGASEIEAALANASRILPLVTTAHLPSAANNNYWPEMYLNQSLFDVAHSGSYGDTPAPKVFGNVSPLDPQLFSRINDFADQLLSNEQSGKYSPAEVSHWLDDYASAATRHLAQAATQIKDRNSTEYRRLLVDVQIQAGLGYFFAAKFLSGVLYRIFERTGDQRALKSSLDQYGRARSAWAEFANQAKAIYLADITVGELPQLRGHWMDRLAAIDQDIAGLTSMLDASKERESSATATAAMKKLSEPGHRSGLSYRHPSPGKFAAGQPLEIQLFGARAVSSVALYYRHVNQAERFKILQMEHHDQQYRATIPGTYTDSPYPLEYYFEIKRPGEALLYPTFSQDLTNQPYFVARRA